MPVRPTDTIAARVRGLLTRLDALRESRFGAPLARGLLLILALGVLALLGDGAAFRTASASSTAPSVGVRDMADAGGGPARDRAATSTPPTEAPPGASATPTAASSPPATDGRCPNGAARERATPDDPVVLNTANSDDLRRLPGVGAKRAQAILDLRVRLGRFRQVDDLLRVRGIGRATLRKLRPLVRVDTPTAISPPAATPPSAPRARTP